MSENKNTIVASDVREEREGRKENTRVMMLFESGNHVDVNASFYTAPSDVVRPIDAYVVTECGGECTQAARCAVEAVYSVYQQINPGVIGARQVVAFDLEGRTASPITGNSGGLAFAVSAAKHIFSHDPGSVAATGHVKSSHDGGSVGGIKGLDAKIRRAIQKLPPGGLILYPTENEKEISDDLRREGTDSGLQFYGVSSVREMLELLFAVKINNKPRDRFGISMLWLFIGILLICGAVFAYTKWGSQQWVSPVPLAVAPTVVESTVNAESSDGSEYAVDTGSSPLKKNSVLTKIENLELPEENEGQLNSSMGGPAHEKEPAVRQQTLNRGFD